MSSTYQDFALQLHGRRPLALLVVVAATAIATSFTIAAKHSYR